MNIQHRSGLAKTWVIGEIDGARHSIQIDEENTRNVASLEKRRPKIEQLRELQNLSLTWTIDSRSHHPSVAGQRMIIGFSGTDGYQIFIRMLIHESLRRKPRAKAPTVVYRT